MDEAIRFSLDSGEVGIIAPEAKRTYDRIVQSNMGIPLVDGLDGDIP
jgi:hypothetical protein